MLKYGETRRTEAEAFVDIIHPALQKLENSRPSLPDRSIIDNRQLREGRDVLLENLALWIEWGKQLEEFVWDYGEDLIGPDYWMPTTDAMQDYKSRIRSLHDGILAEDVHYLQKHGFLSTDSPPILIYDAIEVLLGDGDANETLTEIRRRVDDLERSKNVLLIVDESPFTESPSPSPAPMDAEVY